MSEYSPDLLRMLNEKATEMRKDIVVMVGAAGSGHPGGSLSSADIVSALYFHIMKYDVNNPSWPDRDRFVLSKGHASPVLYAALANAGFFPREEITTFRAINSRLQGHPDKNKLPGVEFSTGSLGQGLSAACGMAIAGKLDNKDYRVFCLIGDGESEEGQIWEAAMSAAHFKLDNLVAVTDFNGLQIDGPTCEIMAINPIPEKWKAFGWNVIEIDGHDYTQILDALSGKGKVPGKPTMIVAKTLKGKCVSYMEDICDWHGKAPNPEQVKQALEDLSCVS
ncbi:MAG: transketolase [Armatimonadota bacterium]|jgi:transketolase|nr:transketolase [Armatimonadota bacterium]